MNRKILEFLERYFNKDFSFKVELAGLVSNLNITQKHKKILSSLLELGTGECICYSEFAKKIGFENQTRSIASLIAKNPLPIIVPCHLIIKKGSEKNKNFGNYLFGFEMKKNLIYFEQGKVLDLPKKDKEFVYSFFQKNYII